MKLLFVFFGVLALSVVVLSQVDPEVTVGVTEPTTVAAETTRPVVETTSNNPDGGNVANVTRGGCRGHGPPGWWGRGPYGRPNRWGRYDGRGRGRDGRGRGRGRDGRGRGRGRDGRRRGRGRDARRRGGPWDFRSYDNRSGPRSRRF